MKKGIKQTVLKYRQSLIILLVCTLLAVVLLLQEQLSDSESTTEVTRQSEGSGTESRTFSYRMDDGEEQQVTVEVNPVERSQEDATELLATAAEQWEAQYLGTNTSENAVTSPLSLPAQFCDNLVTVTYESSNYDVLDTDGSIFWENVPTDGELVELTATFTYAGYSRLESRWILVTQPDADSAEWLTQKLKQKLEATEASTREEENFSLPTKIGTHQIVWTGEQAHVWKYFLLLGIAGAICLEWRKKETIRKAKKERNNSLLMEYPQMVEQISLLLGSGMTIRGAWERILMTDQRMRKETNGKMRVFIEEMWITYREMTKGGSERVAYEHFGARIGLIPYRRFASILSQNLSRGTRDIRNLLLEEAREAMELRKNQARKLGEEAGTKLLFPMLLMFVLILMVLLIPAVLEF
jgi:hypothetical protein